VRHEPHMSRPKRRGIAVVPTLLTLGNVVCGVAAISKLLDAFMAPDAADFSDKIIQAAWLIFLGMIFDALDGRVARLTNQTSEFGVQLDSCTDVVTFGVAPALLVKAVYEHAMAAAGLSYSVKLTFCLCALYAVCAILRLARFAVETDEEESHDTFSGLPTPAAAGVIAAAVIFLFDTGGTMNPFSFSTETVLLLKRIFIILPPILGLLMVSRIPYTHLVNRYVRGRKTFNYLTQGILCLFLLAFCHEWALFLSLTAYVFSGPILLGYRTVRRLLTRSDPDLEPEGRGEEKCDSDQERSE